MVAVDLSLLEPAPEQPREAPVSLDFEKWAAAAGKPCVRQSCGHPHADHIPSEAMECNQCDCPRFIGLAQPDGRRCHGAELTACCERDALPLHAPLYRRAMGMTNNRSDAEDLRQDTMLSAYAGFGSFRQGTNLNGWLHRILTNTYIDIYRKRQRHLPLLRRSRRPADRAEHPARAGVDQPGQRVHVPAANHITTGSNVCVEPRR